MAYGSGLLLISSAVGYFVLERAGKHKGGLKMVGQALGWVIILVSLAGVACQTWWVSKWAGGGQGGYYCPLTSKGRMSPLPGQTPAEPAP